MIAKPKPYGVFFYLLIYAIIFLGAGRQVSAINDIDLSFSHERKLYYSGFELEILASDPGANIIYTLDCSVPTHENGLNYSGKISIDSTTIVKAVAFNASQSSLVYTQTYIFPASSARQPKNPNGFPEEWGGVRIIPGDYEMDPEVINHPDYADQIIEAFESLPSLSLTMDTDEWFNHETGLYVGYPNSNETREKPVTAEFIFNSSEEKSFIVECGVQNQGGTSIKNWKSPKQSMRLLFKEIYGPTRLRKKLFQDSEINSINTLVVDAMLNATWIHPSDDRQRLHAMYLRDQLTSDLYNEMGRLSFHGRYFNLYLNGLYWGIVNLHERPDDAFLSEYLDAEREDFDVIKHGPDEIVSGSNGSYIAMLNSARNGFPAYESLKRFQVYLDLQAFIDYMILNFYLGNFDWARHNFYAGIKKGSGSGYQFFPWDSEHVMRFLELDYDNTGKNNEGSPTEIHTLLKENEEYRLMFADAVYKHLFNDGALTPENFEKSFLFRKNEIEKAIVLESARWGDYRESVSAVTYTKNEYWMEEVNRALEEYIPKRRDIVIDQFSDSGNKLFPQNMPPLIEKENTTTNATEITLKNPNSSTGIIYYTLDGTDPRSVGGGINGIEYTNKITISNSLIIKARFYFPGNSTWSALVEEVFLFDDVYGEKITINEIMYHPNENFPEFIEIMNFGENAVNLNGFEFSDGIHYKFNTDLILDPGAGAVLTNDNYLFTNTYGFSAAGQYEKRLSNSGESIYLNNQLNQFVDSVTYSDTIPWPEIADGDGYSLELKNSNLDNAMWSSWKVSEKINGSPYGTVADSDLNTIIYPNPFADNLTVQFNTSLSSSEIFSIDVFNQTGSKVYSTMSTIQDSKIFLNLAGLLPGMYIIKVGASEQTSFEGGVLKAIKLNR